MILDNRLFKLLLNLSNLHELFNDAHLQTANTQSEIILTFHSVTYGREKERQKERHLNNRTLLQVALRSEIIPLYICKDSH